MWKELTNSIKAILYERAASPLSGVFIGFWILFNWKAIAVFTWGQGEITTKIAYIEAHYVDVWTNLYYPLIATALFIVGYPFLALGPYALWEMVSGWKIGLKQKFESTVALTVAQSIALRKEIRDKEKEFTQSMESKDVRLGELEKENTATNNELSKLKDAVSSRGDAETQLVKMTERLAAAESRLTEVGAELHAARQREAELTKTLQATERELRARRTTSEVTGQETWDEEYDDELAHDQKFMSAMDVLLRQIGTPTRMIASDDVRAYGISKGLIEITDNKGTVKLTPKGQYLARHAYQK